MFRVLFLLLVLTGSFAFAQTEDKTLTVPKPKAVKILEFEKATYSYVRVQCDALIIALQNEPSAQGYIINYGSNKEIAKREKLIRNAIAFRKYDSSRITLVRGGFRKVIKTEFWVVPAGAEPPIPRKEETNAREETPTSVKLEEFQKLTNGYVKIKMHRFFTELKKNPTSQGYIINYGANREIAKRERQIKDAISFFKYDSSKVTLVRGGSRKVIKTQFWVVPVGAEVPKLRR